MLAALLAKLLEKDWEVWLLEKSRYVFVGGDDSLSVIESSKAWDLPSLAFSMPAACESGPKTLSYCSSAMPACFLP